MSLHGCGHGMGARLEEGDRRRPEAARPPMAARRRCGSGLRPELGDERRGWAGPWPGPIGAGPAQSAEERFFLFLKHRQTQ